MPKDILLYDYKRAADALSMSEAALRNLVHRGKGPKVTKIRNHNRTFFAPVDLEAFVEAHRNPVPVPSRDPVTRPVKKRRRGRPSLVEIMEG